MKAQTLSASTIFLSAFLLFAVEPLIAKKILPWFGGSAAVWSMCLVFFQFTLLVGYAYARVLAKYVRPAAAALIHIALLVLSLVFLPLGPAGQWRPDPTHQPTWLLLRLLAATIGLPFGVLSATSPLLQNWLARSGHATPHRLFALSNLASLLALVSYPLLIEPKFDLRTQSIAWSAGYLLFAVLCASVSWTSRTQRDLPTVRDQAENESGMETKVAWFALAACGAMLLLSITNHVTENVASVPFLWVFPLATYLLTFVLTFHFTGFYRRPLFLRVLVLGLGLVAYAIYDIRAIEILQVSVPIFLFGLFAGCMFCHGELNRLRPGARQLTGFYLIVALGGATGSIFVGLIAPQVFRAIYELPLSLVLTAALALALTWREGWTPRGVWVTVTVCMMIVFGMNVKAYEEDSLSMRRSFYGSLRVVQSPRAGEQQTRTLFHGTITHGAQFVLPPKRYRATTYYGPDSGIGILLREGFAGPKKVGVVGLGVGTLAAYGKPGDTFRFYEINRQVIELAQSLFTYLRETPAQVQIVEGDARLSMEQERSTLDVLAVDAFSGDAIPVHLLTLQAVRLYLSHLRTEGVLAFHVSNQYLDLSPVVQKLAQATGRSAMLVRNHGDDDELVMPADWVLVTNNESVLNNASLKVHEVAISARPDLRVWTDDFNDLWSVLKPMRR